MLFVTLEANKVVNKLGRFGPFVTKLALNTAASYFNRPEVKESFYPPSQSGSPFAWSSDKQRRYVYANEQLPYSRTFNLARDGTFRVNEENMRVEYTNTAPGWIFVFHKDFMIIGHRRRGWQPINKAALDKWPSGLDIVKAAVSDAWKHFS